MKLLTLDNGLRVVLNSNDSLRSAIVGVWVASGPRYETKEVNGISHFIEHIVFKGSKNRTAFEIAQGFDEIGATSNAYTTKEYTFFHTHALDYQIISATDILFDMIKNPKLDSGDLETEKGVVIEEIAMCEDDPSDVCYELHEQKVFADSSMALDILGTRESVKNLSAQMIEEYMQKYYVPERMVIGISGKFDEDEFMQKVNEYFAEDENTNNALDETELKFNETMALKKGNFEQTHIQMSFNGISHRHEDLDALRVCTFILGTGTSSKLNQRIREQLGLVYSIDAWLGRYLGGGYLAISMSLNSNSEHKAITESLKIVKGFCESITEKEVRIAKEKLISMLIISREHPQSRFSSLGMSQLLFNRFIEDEEIIDGIKAVTIEQVKNVAKKYLTLDKMAFTAVGKIKDEEEYKKMIKEFEGEKQ